MYELMIALGFGGTIIITGIICYVQMKKDFDIAIKKEENKK